MIWTDDVFSPKKGEADDSYDKYKEKKITDDAARSTSANNQKIILTI